MTITCCCSYCYCCCCFRTTVGQIMTRNKAKISLCSAWVFSVPTWLTPTPLSNDCFWQTSPSSGLRCTELIMLKKNYQKKKTHSKWHSYAHVQRGGNEPAWLFPFPTAQITEKKKNQRRWTNRSRKRTCSPTCISSCPRAATSWTPNLTYSI